MIWTLDSQSLTMAFAVVAMLSFLFGLVLDRIMGEDGFGAFGNMIVLSGGFFLGLTAANELGYRLSSVQFATAVGIGGAFLAVLFLALCKAGLQRFLMR